MLRGGVSDKLTVVFIFRTLDRDSSGTIGFMELMMALDLVGANKYTKMTQMNLGFIDCFLTDFKMK